MMDPSSFMGIDSTSFVPNSQTLQILKTCIPPEVRLQIFRIAFQPEGAREVINVVLADGKLDLEYKDQHKQRQHQAFERRKLWLQPNIVGQDLALEAAEALYQSRFMFAVHADHCVALLSQCPLSGLANPGLAITRMILLSEEEKNFLGEGRRGTGLRLSDWHSLTQDCSVRRQTRSMQGRTATMQRCWRAVCRMPRLSHLECRITPAGGRLPAHQVKSWEIRDMVPALWRLARNGVDVHVYFRTWDKLNNTTLSSNPFTPASIPDPEDPSLTETAIDVTDCLPFTSLFMRPPPSTKERARAHLLLRQGFDRCLPTREPIMKRAAFFATQNDIIMFHRVKVYDALEDFSRRLYPRTGMICIYTATSRNANSKQVSKSKTTTCLHYPYRHV